MNNGIDKMILESKMKLTDTVNEIIKNGIPFSVISLILENIMANINVYMNQVILDEENTETSQKEE